MSIAYIIFNKVTGEVLRSGLCQPGYECDQIKEDERAMCDYLCLDNHVDPNLYVVVDGVLTPKDR